MGQKFLREYGIVLFYIANSILAIGMLLTLFGRQRSCQYILCTEEQGIVSYGPNFLSIENAETALREYEQNLKEFDPVAYGEGKVKVQILTDCNVVRSR